MKVKLIVGGVAALVLAIVVGTVFKSILFDERFARSELDGYLEEMYAGEEVRGQSCTGRDTDGDGYVSCSARIVGKDGQVEVVPLECASDLLNSGCKTRVGVVKVAK